jgi:hypothetical protein
MTLQRVQTGNHPIEGRLSALVDAVPVVQLARAIDRDADEEVALCQEGGPLVVDQRGIRLQRVEDPLPRRRVPRLEFEGAPEEVDAHQRRLATLEGDHHLVGTPLRREQLADVRLVHVRRHAEPAAGIELLLRQEEAVLAIQVADRSGRLRHHVEGP